MADHKISPFSENNSDSEKDHTISQYQEIIENVTDAIIYTDKNFHIVTWNKAAEEIYGWKREEVIGKRMKEIVPTKIINSDKDSALEVLMDKGIWSGDAIQERKDGKKIFVISSVRLIHDASGNIVGSVGINKDITTRKKTEKLLRQSEQQYRTLLENAQEGIWAIDEDNHTTYVNKKMAKMLGYTIKEMIGKHLFTFMNEESQKAARLNLEKGKGGLKKDYIFKFLKKDGSELPTKIKTSPLTDAKGNYKGAIACVADISEQLKAEHKLKERIKELNCLYGISKLNEKSMVTPDYVLEKTLNLIPIAMLYPELAYARILWNKNEFLTDNYKKTPWILRRELEIGDKSLSLEIGYLEEKAFLEEERRLAKDILSRLKSIIEQNLAVQRLQRLISTVSHELRTPITVLNLSLDYYQDSGGKIEEVLEKLLEGVARNIKLLKELADDLSMISSIDEDKIKLNIQKCDLSKLITEMLIIFKPIAASKSINFNLDLPSKLEIKADPIRLDQILRIFVDNAIKYSEENSTISIKVLQNYTGKFNPDQKPGYLIEIKDDGIGISDADKEFIFERFFRSEEVMKTPGSGLGLSIAQDLIDLHQGEVFLETEEGKGTTFSIFIPSNLSLS